MLIAQITDTHIQMPGGSIDANYRTAEHLARAVAHLNTLQPQPDVVLHTGDTVEEGTEAEYGLLRELLSELSAPVYVIPGNHDHRARMRAAFTGDDYLPENGFLHYAIEHWPLRLIGLDTQVEGASHGELCGERLSWLAHTLDSSPERPTVIFMHHPPFRSGHTLMDSMGLLEPGPFAEIVKTHSQIRHILCGHMHQPLVSSFSGAVTTVSPSTAHQIALDLGPTPGMAVCMENPAVTLLQWDAEADALVHYLSYTEGRPRHVVHDGLGWCGSSTLPPGFHR